MFFVLRWPLTGRRVHGFQRFHRSWVQAPVVLKKIVKIKFINKMNQMKIRIILKFCNGTSLFSIWLKDSRIKHSKAVISLIKKITICNLFYYTMHEFVCMAAHFLSKDYIFPDDKWRFDKKHVFIFRELSCIQNVTEAVNKDYWTLMDIVWTENPKIPIIANRNPLHDFFFRNCT